MADSTPVPATARLAEVLEVELNIGQFKGERVTLERWEYRIPSLKADYLRMRFVCDDHCEPRGRGLGLHTCRPTYRYSGKRLDGARDQIGQMRRAVEAGEATLIRTVTL